MSLTYRPACADDEGPCLSLLGELGGASLTPADVMAPVFTALLDSARGEVIVAEEDGELLGLASVSYNLAMRYGGEYCQLEELILSPAARGKKLGGLLLQTVIDNAKARGCAEMGLYLLESTEHNRTFYAKYGFEAIGTEMRQQLAD